MDYNTAPIQALRTECLRLRQRADRANDELALSRQRDGAFSADSDDTKGLIRIRNAAESNANRCDAALIRREQGQAPDPSATATATGSDFKNRGEKPSGRRDMWQASNTTATVAGGSNIGAVFNANTSARNCGNGGKCLDSRKFGRIQGGAFVRGKCPGGSHIQCLEPTAARGTAGRRGPTKSGPVAPVTAGIPSIDQVEVELPKQSLLGRLRDARDSGKARVDRLPQAAKLGALFLLPIGAALIYKEMA